MGIVVREVSDDDLPRAGEIEGAAFSTDPLSPLLFPGPFPPDSQQQRANQLQEIRKKDPTVRLLQAYDEETGKMLAFSKWHIYDTPELAATGSARPMRSFGPGTNRAGCEAFFGGLAKKKPEIMGTKSHIYLHLLVTDPEFQRRGAGSALLEWGTKKADELGIPMYLESSEPGYRIYQRYGFKDVDTFTLDATKYGGTGVLRTPLMVREPNST